MKNSVVSCLLVCAIIVSSYESSEATQPTACQEDGQRPNILLIYVDDLGWKDLGCYGSDFHESPNIDKLISEGVRFTDAYSCAPLCAPSRIALLSGLHCARNGTFEVTGGAWNESRYMLQSEGRDPSTIDENWQEKVDYVVPSNRLDLPRDRKILPEYLKEACYFTGFMGKWHVGRQTPKQRGFDEYVNFTAYRPGQLIDVRTAKMLGKTTGYPEPEGSTADYMAKTSLHFIDSWQKGERRPFFLYMSHPLVHTPIEAEPLLIDKYRAKDKGLLHSNPVYAAMIEMLDNSIGQVIEGLKQRGIYDDTLIIITSDNGGSTGPRSPNSDLGGYEVGTVTSPYPLRGGKVQLWEGGVRVPMGIVFGDRFSAAVCDIPVTQLDIMPTLLDIVDHSDYETDPESLLMDGTSLSSILDNAMTESTANWSERSLFWHFPAYRGLSIIPQPGGRLPDFLQRPATTVRRGDWKLHESLETGNVQLYNLRNDIGEANNLAADHPVIVGSLKAELKAWRAEVKAPMPTRKSRKTAGEAVNANQSRPMVESPDHVLLQVDAAKDIGPLKKSVMGLTIDPPRGFNSDGSPRHFTQGAEQGHNVRWLDRLHPATICAGWGGDVFWQYNPWPVDPVEDGQGNPYNKDGSANQELYDFEPLINYLKPHRETGREVVLTFCLTPEWLWDIDRYDDNDAGTTKLFWYMRKGHTRPPEDYTKWRTIVADTIVALEEAGIHPVCEILNEPNVRWFWNGTDEEAFRFYAETAQAIKSVSTLKVGGPGVAVRNGREIDGNWRNQPDWKWIDDWMAYQSEANAPIDFVSWHYYHQSGVQSGAALNYRQMADRINQMCTEHGIMAKERRITEFAYYWSPSEMPAPMYNASYLPQCWLETLDSGINYAYYTGPMFARALDQPRPGNNTWSMASTMGDRRLVATYKDEDVPLFATKDSTTGKISVLAWNHPDHRAEGIEAIDGESKDVTINIRNLQEGQTYAFRRLLVSNWFHTKPDMVDQQTVVGLDTLQLTFKLRPYTATLLELTPIAP